MPSQPAPPVLPPFNPARPVFREQPVEPVRPARSFEASPPPPLPQSQSREIAAYDDEAALERQRRMAEQLAELEAARRQARRDAQALAETGAQPQTVAELAGGSGARSEAAKASPGVRGLAADLRDPKALRRAMVLREVLDAPVALRRAS
jgi:hypothetical protein